MLLQGIDMPAWVRKVLTTTEKALSVFTVNNTHKSWVLGRLAKLGVCARHRAGPTPFAPPSTGASAVRSVSSGSGVQPLGQALPGWLVLSVDFVS